MGLLILGFRASRTSREKSANLHQRQDSHVVGATRETRHAPQAESQKVDHAIPSIHQTQDAQSSFSEEAARLLREGMTWVGGFLTADLDLLGKQSVNLRQLFWSLTHRIISCQKAGQEPTKFQEARAQLTRELGALIRQESVRHQFPQATTLVLEALGESKDPASIEWLVRYIDYRDMTSITRATFGSDYPAFRALATYSGTDSAESILSQASADDTQRRTDLIAASLIAACGGQVPALERVRKAIANEADAPRARMLADLTVTISTRAYLER